MNQINSESAPVWAVGFMTGTSIDAVDAAMILTDGIDIIEFGPVAELPYSADDRAIIGEAVRAARAWNWCGPRPDEAFAAACAIAVGRHSEALDMLLEGWTGPDPVIIGVHGQTVLHRRPQGNAPGATLQIIDAAGLAHRFGLPMAYDFRSADIAAGGEGAPLAPVYHEALLKRSGLGDAAVVNLGGVANITARLPGGGLVAFDTGPANGPIDEWVAGHGRGTHDSGGRFAMSGTVHEDLLAQILDHPYFAEPPPKSLDRYDFDANLARGLSFEDGAATLTALCAGGIARALEHAGPVKTLVLCGGGRHNPAMIEAIARATDRHILTAEQVGWRGDSIEAEAFAFLAVRRLRGLPISFPGTTGVPEPMTGGRLWPE